MKLADYVKKVGHREFAARFGIKERTALSYQHGTRTPRRELAQRIVDGSPVTWRGIYGVPDSVEAGGHGARA